MSSDYYVVVKDILSLTAGTIGLSNKHSVKFMDGMGEYYTIPLSEVKENDSFEKCEFYHDFDSNIYSLPECQELLSEIIFLVDRSDFFSDLMYKFKESEEYFERYGNTLYDCIIGVLKQAEDIGNDWMSKKNNLRG